VKWFRSGIDSARRVLGGAPLLLLTVGLASAAGVVVVEDWSRYDPGTHGVPPGWESETWGRASSVDLTVEREGDRNVLHLRSRGDRSTISLPLRDRLRLDETPVLEWSWKVTELPRGGNARVKATSDLAAQVYVVWPRPPALFRSRIIGYVWDTTAPVGAEFTSTKTGTVTYVVLRSGAEELGTWLTERRNVAEDFRRIYGEDPPNPGAISLSIDSNDTRSSAESFIGAIIFRGP
jgi:DUF3047 family protein